MSTAVEDPFYRHVPAFFGLSLEELIAVKHPDAWLRFERDEINEADFLREFFTDGRTYDHEGLRQALFQNYRWIPGMEILLSQLQQAGVSLHWVSNYPIWYREIDARLSLRTYAPWTFVSCHEGVRKPDPAVFRIVLTRTELAAADCLFVDDQETNCAAARRHGIDALRFTSTDDLRRELEARGVL